jgi:hypothetical protein
MMETYTLVTLVALFLGVMGVIAMMEHRRRTDLAQYEQLHQTLTACLGSLQAIHSGNETQMAQVAAALSQLHGTIQTSAAASSESTRNLSAEAARAVEQASVKLSGVAQANSKELVERLDVLPLVAKRLVGRPERPEVSASGSGFSRFDRFRRKLFPSWPSLENILPEVKTASSTPTSSSKATTTSPPHALSAKFLA